MAHGDKTVEVVGLILTDEFGVEFNGEGVTEGDELGAFVPVYLGDVALELSEENRKFLVALAEGSEFLTGCGCGIGVCEGIFEDSDDGFEVWQVDSCGSGMGKGLSEGGSLEAVDGRDHPEGFTDLNRCARRIRRECSRTRTSTL